VTANSIMLPTAPRLTTTSFMARAEIRVCLPRRTDREQHAALGSELAASTASMARGAVGGYVGEEAQAPEVHAHEGHAVLRHHARAGNERAVAADDDREVRLAGSAAISATESGARARRRRWPDPSRWPSRGRRNTAARLVEDIGQARRVALADDGRPS
jgi:hypothetical protein